MLALKNILIYPEVLDLFADSVSKLSLASFFWKRVGKKRLKISSAL